MRRALWKKFALLFPPVRRYVTRHGALARRHDALLAERQAVVGADAVVLNKRAANVRVAYHIDNLWCDKYGIYLEGWLHCFERRLTQLRIVNGNTIATANILIQRPDLKSRYPDYPNATAAGFSVYSDWRIGEPLEFVVSTDVGEMSLAINLPKFPIASIESQYFSSIIDPLEKFIRLANERGGTILEVGSRAASSSSWDKRARFPKASRYIGFDIHPGAGVDLVGDAHSLCRHVGEQSIDAMFSVAVLEHFAAPWMVAAEMNRALRLGGIIFHVTHQSWPLHEMPNDYFRFSSGALAGLFGPDMGFEIIDHGMLNEIYMTSQRRDVASYLTMPFSRGYAESFIIARKVRDIGLDAVRWPLGGADSEALAKHYPRRA